MNEQIRNGYSVARKGREISRHLTIAGARRALLRHRGAEIRRLADGRLADAITEAERR